jgi:hypothetical protein
VLLPVTQGATANPELWLCTISLWTLREGSSGDGRPDFPVPPKKRRLKAQQQQQVTAPEESKTRRRGEGRFAISNLRRPQPKGATEAVLGWCRSAERHSLIIRNPENRSRHKKPARGLEAGTESAPHKFCRYHGISRNRIRGRRGHRQTYVEVDRMGWWRRRVWPSTYQASGGRLGGEGYRSIPRHSKDPTCPAGALRLKKPPNCPGGRHTM